MANHMFVAEIKELERKLNDTQDMLVNLQIEMTDYFGEVAPCTKQCETVMDHIERAINSLSILDRRIPRSYTPESRDRGA